MIKRISEKDTLQLLGSFPCAALVGPRQIGKTTLAKQIAKKRKGKSIYIDLELKDGYARLEDPETFLRQHADKLVIIDEVQRMPSLFSVLRGIIDEKRKNGRFLLLGSTSPNLIRNSSESLAGRIGYKEMFPLVVPEVAAKYSIESLWLKGGFPDAFLEKSNHGQWMSNFITTYLERDLPQMGFSAPRIIAERLWYMLANSHGGLINYSDYSKSLEITDHTVKKYIDFLQNAFLVRQLQPYHSNLSKRIVKSPKVYIRDSGILHYMLGIETMDDLIGNPKMGASWEGFVIEQIAALLKMNRKIFFYRTHDGAELDLVIEKGGKPLAGVEIKYGSDFRPNKGNTMALKTLQTKHNYVVVQGKDDYETSSGFRVCGLAVFLKKYLPEL